MPDKPCYFSVLASILLSAIGQVAVAQAKVSWGEEFKMHKGSTDLTILQADRSGIYLEESHEVLRSYFVIGYSVRRSGTLVKLDNSMKEQYRNDFDKELKGKDYDRLFFIRDKLYLFATDYVKKDKALYLYAAEIDKSSGNLKGDWQEIYAWQKNDKSEQIDYRIAPNGDSSRIVLTGTYTGKEQNRYEIKMMDIDLHPVGKPMTISNEFDPKTFQVAGFVYTPSGNAILVGRIYDYEDGKKKKDKNLVFLHYSIRLYDPEGKLISDIKTDIDGKYLVSSRVVEMTNHELILAAFYSNDKKKREINGLLVERLDPATGNVLVSTKQELNKGLVSAVDDDEDDNKPKRKDQDGDHEAGLSGNIIFRRFFVTSDNGLVILAEKYDEYLESSSVFMPSANPNSPGSWNNTSILHYLCDDIYMAKISAAGSIEWLHDLPKSQDESIQMGSTMGANAVSYVSYFHDPSNRPFFAGFGSFAGRNVIHIFFNDMDANAEIVQQGKKIKRARNFEKTSCYEIDLDPMTGKYTRSSLFSNKDIPVSMPRLGVAMNNTLYLTGKHDRGLAKTKLIVGKISMGE